VTEESLATIKEWCAADPSLEFGEGDPPTITMTDGDPFVIAVQAGDGGIRLVHEIEGAEPVSRTIADVSARHSFMAAVYDLVGAAEAAEARAERERDAVAAAEAARKAAADAEKVAEQTAASAAAAAEVAATKRAEAAEAERALAALRAGAEAVAEAAAPAAAAQPAAQTAAQTAAQPVAEAVAAAPGATFAPTHRVPEGGMQAWDVPDGSTPVKAELAARVELRLDEERGAWARVTGSNGWTGWVDGRRLERI